MNRYNLNTKRQLLADLLAGKTDSLRAYKAISQQQTQTPYQWVVTNEMAETVYGVFPDGGQHPLTADDLTELPKHLIWRIVDHSGGIRIPEPDEDWVVSQFVLPEP